MCPSRADQTSLRLQSYLFRYKFPYFGILIGSDFVLAYAGRPQPSWYTKYMKKTKIIAIGILVILGTVSYLYQRYSSTESFTKTEEGLISSVDTASSTPKYTDLKAEYKGEEITSSTTLGILLKIENDANTYHDAKFIRAYKYGDLIYASISTGESGWHRVFLFKDGNYEIVTGGQDIPSCKSFDGYQVSKGLWCRLGGCFVDAATIKNSFNDCRL